jgi:putative ABC transport system ATP-binding protein
MSLIIKHLSKHYDTTPVFSQVSLRVAPGEFVAIIGESGVGKSTLLNCMAGLDNWNSGSVMLDGQDLGALNADQLAHMRREKTGFVFQAFHVLPHLSVAQNVALPLMLLGRQDDARVQDMLNAVGLDDLGARLPQQLSGGQLQRVAIARALIHAPKLLLADEPTGNLDTHRSKEIMDLLWKLNVDHGITVLMVTHEADMAAYAKRIVHFVDGVVDSDTRNPHPAGLTTVAPTAAEVA